MVGRKVLTRAVSLLGFVLLLAPGFASAAPASGGEELWQRGDAQVDNQRARAVTVDATGALVVVGTTGEEGSLDYFVTKFAADGASAAWRMSYDHDGGDDRTADVVVDSNADVLVAGYVWNAISYDFHVIKYDGASGAVLWQRTYDSGEGADDYLVGVAVDAADAVYVAGYGQGLGGADDLLLVKYAADGTPVWQRSFDGGRHDRALGLAVGAAGVVVTGESDNGTDFDCLTLAYDLSGTLAWNQSRAYTGNDACSLAHIAPDGAVILGGRAYNGKNWDLYAAKRAWSNGALLWDFTRDGGYGEQPSAVTTDAGGDVYVTGHTFSVATADDVYIVRLDGSSGTALWSETHNTWNGNGDRGVDVVVAADGEVFVIGDSFDVEAGGFDFLLVKYAGATGNLLWERLFDGAASRDDHALGLGLTAAGVPVVGGFSDQWTAGNLDYDFHAISYKPGVLNRPTGLVATATAADQIVLSWEDNESEELGLELERRTLPSGSFALLVALGADVTGYTDLTVSADSEYEYRVRAIGAAGETDYSDVAWVTTAEASFAAPVWTYIYAGADGSDDLVGGVAVGPDTNPVVTGSSYSLIGQFDYVTVKLDRETSAEQWDARHDGDQNDVDMGRSITVDHDNSVVVSGDSLMYNFPVGNNNNIYTMKYEPISGQKQWGVSFDGPASDDDRATAVAVTPALDGSGYTVVGYGKNTDWDNDLYVLRYDEDGAQVWAATPFDGGVLGDDVPTAVGFDVFGDVYVAGYTQGSGNLDMVLLRYSAADGSLIWSATYNGVGDGDDFANSVAVGYSAVFVSGGSRNAAGNDDFYTIKYDLAGGAPVWERAWDGSASGDDEAVGVAVDPISGHVVVAGTSVASDGNHDFSAVRYDPDGNVLWEKTVARPDDDDHAKTAVMNPSGHTYIAGETNSGAGWDVLAVILDENGVQVGGTTYDGASGGEERVTSLAVSRLGEAFAAGYTMNGNGDFDYLVLKIRNPLMQVPAPLDVTPSYTSVAVTWGDNAIDEEGYELQRRDGACDAGTPWLALHTASPNETSFEDTGLPLDTQYCYRITTYKTGETSRPVIASTTTLVPTPPGPLLATPSNTTTVGLTWADNTDGEDGFRVQRCEGAGCIDYADLVTLGAETTSYSDVSPCEDTAYEYRVEAFVIGEWTSDPSASAPAATPAATAPTAAAAIRVSEAAVDLTWTDTTTDETGYRVERCAGADCTDYAVVATLGPNSDDWSNVNLSHDTLYRYRVGPYKNASCAWYTPSSALEATTTLLAPGSLAASVADTTTINLTWTDRTATETGFELWRCAGSDCTDFAYLGAAAANATSWQDATACHSTTYRYQALSTRSGVWTSVGSVATPDKTTGTPLAPSDLAALALSEAEIGLSWTDNTTDETGFGIERCEGATCTEFASVATVGAGVTDYVDLGVTPGTTYRYQVLALKDVPCAWTDLVSDIAAATSDSPPPPTALTATAISETRVDLTWEDNTGSETGFLVERCEGAAPCSGAFSELGTSGPDDTSFSDLTACHSTTYSYRLSALNEGLSNRGGGCWTSRAPLEFTAFEAAARAEVTVAYAAEMQPDFDDLRFYDETTGIELEYWLKTKVDGVSATLWLLTGSYDTINMYYGNANATSSSTAEHMSFEYADSFVGDTIDSADWIEIDPNGSIEQDDGLILNDVSSGWNKALISQRTFARAPGTVLYMDLTVPPDTPGNNHLMIGWEANQTTNPSYQQLVHGMYWNNYSWSTYQKGRHSGSNGGNYAQNTDYEMRIELKAAGALYYVRGGAHSDWYLVRETSNYTDATMRVAFCQYSHQLKVNFLAVMTGGLSKATVGTPETGSCFVFSGTWSTEASDEADDTTLTPQTPDNVEATAVSESVIRVSWQDLSVAEEAFELERCEGVDCTEFLPVAAAATDETSYDDSGLTPATHYRYRLKATSDAACAWDTGFGLVVDGETLTPAAPTGLTGAAVSTTQIALTWTDETNSETLFRVQRCAGAGCMNFADLGTSAADVAAYDDASTCNGVTYRYRVRAENPAWGVTTWSLPFEILSPAQGVPANLVATRVSEVEVSLVWADTASDEDGFRIERCAGEACVDYSQIGVVAADTVEFADPGLVPSTTYSYRVRGTKTASCSWDAQYSNAPIVVTTILSPSVLVATAASTTDITLTWQDNSVSETGFTIERCEGSCDFSEVESFQAPADATTYEDVDACESTAYRYRVRATGFAGPIPESASSGLAEATSQAPNLPAGMLATVVTDTSALVAWTDTNADETGYRIERCAEAGCAEFAEVDTVAADATSYLDVNLTPEAWFRYRVVALKGSSCAWERPSGVSTIFTSPAKPESLLAIALNSQAIELDWTDLSSDEEGFEVERLLFNGTYMLRATLGAGVTTFVDTMGIEPFTEYTYRVRAVRGDDRSGYSNQATVATPAWQAEDHTCL